MNNLSKFEKWIAHSNIDNLMLGTSLSICAVVGLVAYLFDKPLSAFAQSHPGYYGVTSGCIYAFGGLLVLLFRGIQSIKDEHNHQHNSFQEPWDVGGHKINICSCNYGSLRSSTILYTKEFNCPANPFKDKKGMCEFPLYTLQGDFQDTRHILCKHCGVSLGERVIKKSLAA